MVSFNVSLEKEKEGKAPIYMCIMVEGKKTWVAIQQKMLLDRDLKVVCYNRAVKILIKKVYEVDMQVGMDVKQFINVTYMSDFVKHCGRALAGESIRHQRLLTFANDSL